MSTTVPQPHERGQRSIAPSGRSRAVAALARTPEAVVVALIVGVGALFIAVSALRVPGWGVMTDELLYVKLALHSADALTPLPAVHRQSFSQFTPIYPLVLAPIYGLLSTPAAFAVGHAMNALLMASAAIPAFLLARLAGARRVGAYLAAALTVAAPWTVYSYFLMTEALAYPVFVWAVLACAVAVARPSWRADAVALAAIVFAVLTRTQFVVLAVALPAAIVVHELGRLRTAAGAVLREHAPVVACGAIGLLVVAALALTGGVGRATGNYHVLFSGDSIPPGTLAGVRPHLLVLVVGVGIVPFLAAVAWTIDALASPGERGANAVATLLLFTVPAVVLVTAAFNRRQLGDLVQDRYAFYVVPLFFAATGAYLLGVARRRLSSLVLSALVTCWILLDFKGATRHTYSYVDSAHRVIKGWLGKVGLHGTVIGLVLCLVALAVTALLIWARSGRAARVVPAALAIATLGFCVVESAHNFQSVLVSVRAQLRAYGVADDSRNWVDDALPSGASAAIVPGVVGDVQRSEGAWWDVEFWNSKITDQYDYAPAYDVTPFPKRILALDWASGGLSVAGPRVGYLVLPAADRRFQPRGTAIASRDGLLLMRPAQPLRAAWAIRDTDKDGWTFAGKPATIRLYPSRGERGAAATVTVELTSTSDVAGSRRYQLSGGTRPVRGTLMRASQTHVSVPVCVQPERPKDLGVAIRGSSTLPSGEEVGLAVTRVQVRPRGDC